MIWTRRIRIVYQGFFLVLFLWMLQRLAAGDARDLPFASYFHADPLAAVGVTLAAGTLPGALIWFLLLVAVTLVFGRVFCGWVCPLGTLQQLSSWLLSPRSKRESLLVNRYRRWYAIKYYVLAALLGGALVGSLQTGLLDPLSLLARGLASGVWPLLPGGRPVPGGWLAALLLLAIVLASRWIPRLFCRAFCPLGALLGVLARFSLFRIERRGDACTSCVLLHLRLPGRRRAAQGAPRRRVPRLPQLPAGVPGERHLLPSAAAAAGAAAEARPVAPLPDRLDRRRVRRLPRPARRRRRPRRGARDVAAPAGRAAGERVPRPLREVLAVPAGVPAARPPPRNLPGRRRGFLDAGADPAPRLVRARLHPLRRGVPDRRDRAA